MQTWKYAQVAVFRLIFGLDYLVMKHEITLKLLSLNLFLGLAT